MQIYHSQKAYMLSIQTIINHSKPVYWLLSIYLHINTMHCKKLHTTAPSVFYIPAATCRHQNPDLDNHAATDLWNSTSECSANHPPYLLQSSPFNREMCCITLVADYDKHPMVSNFPLKHRSVTVCISSHFQTAFQFIEHCFKFHCSTDITQNSKRAWRHTQPVL